jgi:hypothetical protein
LTPLSEVPDSGHAPRQVPGPRVLSETELANLRRQIEDFDTIEVISAEMRELIERAFPDLVHKLPPAD